MKIRCTYAWDEEAVTKTNDSFEILAYIGLLSDASIPLHQSLQGGSLVQQVEAKIVLLAGRPN